MIEQVKLLSMTAVLTVLIWASADSLVNETVSIRVAVEVVPRLPNSSMLVRIDPDPGAGAIDVQVSGPRRLIEDIQAEEPLTIRVRVPEQPTGQTSLPLEPEIIKRGLVEHHSEYRKLTVVGLQQTAVPLSVDHLMAIDLPVATNRLTLPYEVAPQPTPSTITVRLRESWYTAMLLPDQRSHLDITTEVERQLRSRPPGVPATISVAVDSSPFGPGAELNPPRIDVVATVKADRRTADIPTVPIKLVVSFASLSKSYQAIARDGSVLTLETQTIKVTGPTEDVARLLDGTTRAYGFIQLKEADLENLGSYRAWLPRFHLPANLELAEDPEPLEFKLIEATGTAIN
ncbi:MAG: hypothetical protein KJ749_06760 [Planctomycetes bacterium]|nr:hypothetical protein [Planctomycetota bacterium]